MPRERDAQTPRVALKRARNYLSNLICHTKPRGAPTPVVFSSRYWFTGSIIALYKFFTSKRVELHTVNSVEFDRIEIHVV